MKFLKNVSITFRCISYLKQFADEMVRHYRLKSIGEYLIMLLLKEKITIQPEQKDMDLLGDIQAHRLEVGDE